MQKVSTMRRAVGALAVALGLMAVAGPGASAADDLQDILSGEAGSTALRIRLELPTLAELKATLTEVGLPLSALPAVELPDSIPLEIDQILSMTHGTVVRADEDLPDGSNGFAASGTGTLELLNNSVTTSCKAGSCDTAKTVSGPRIDLPLGLGYVDLARASSESPSATATTNEAGVAKVHLDLGGLIDKGQPLAALGDIFGTLTTTVNDNVLPPVNTALETVESTVKGLLPDEIEDPIFQEADELGLITHIGPVKPLPDLRDVDLANLRIIGADSIVGPYTHDGVAGLRSKMSAGVADLDILGDWTTADALTVESLAQANGTKAGTKATSDVKMIGAELGGALGLAIDYDDISFLVDPDKLDERLTALFKDLGLDNPTTAQVVDELVATHSLLKSIAGISVAPPSKFAEVDPSDAYAWAKSGADSIVLTVAPTVPKLSALLENLPSADAIVPRLDEDDFVPTGIRLTIEFPRGDARVAIGEVQDRVFRPTGRTGVGSIPWIVSAALLAGAVVVRRFVLVK